MAVLTRIFGFEMTNQNVDSRGAIMFDRRRARSGRGYLKMARWGTGSNQSGFSWGGGTTQSPGNNGVAKRRGRIWFRLPILPSTPVALLSVDFGTVRHIGIGLHPNGALTAFWSNGNNSTFGESAQTSTTAPVGVTDDHWVKVEFDVDIVSNVTPGAPTNLDECEITFTVTFPNGTTETRSMAFAPVDVGVGTGPMISEIMRNTFGFDANNDGDTYEIDFDDLITMTAVNDDIPLMPALPAADRIAGVEMTGPGTEQEWTGDWWITVPFASILPSGDSNRIVSNAAGQRATYLHQTAAQLGLGQSIQAVEVKVVVGDQNVSEIIIGNQNLSWYSVNGESSGISRAACRWGPWSQEDFNALEFGVENVNNLQPILVSVTAEVLHDGARWTPMQQGVGGFRMDYVQWVGDGSQWQVVTTRTPGGDPIGYEPHLVWAWAHENSIYDLYFIDHPPGKSLTAQTTNYRGVISMRDGGFAVGLQLNASGVTYEAMIFRDDGNAVGGRVVVAGSRARPLADDTHILTYEQPIATDHVFLMSRSNVTGNARLAWRAEGMEPTWSFDMHINSSAQRRYTDVITALLPNGFSTGANSDWGSSNIHCTPFFGFRITPQFASFFAHGFVEAQAAPAVVPMPNGRAPFFVVASSDDTGTSNNQPTRRLDTNRYPDANSSLWSSGNNNVTNGVTAFDLVNGTFTIGSRCISATKNCYWFAFSQTALLPPVPPSGGFRSGVVEHPITWLELTMLKG